MGWVIREVSFLCNAPDEEGEYRAYATDERQSRSRPSTEKGRAKRLTHFSDGLLDSKEVDKSEHRAMNSACSPRKQHFWRNNRRHSPLVQVVRCSKS
ncbi:MAG: hypothetical protein KTR25_06300 [Myxococcales bacterium]|nr:hypothetical protein [Myxococcales bacterium]